MKNRSTFGFGAGTIFGIEIRIMPGYRIQFIPINVSEDPTPLNMVVRD